MTVCYTLPAWVPPVFAGLFAIAIAVALTLGLLEHCHSDEW